MIRVVESFSSIERLAFAHEFIGNFAAGTEILLVGASRDAVDGLARQFAATHASTFGLHRFSLLQLAAHLAAGELAATGLSPSTRLAAEAIAARAVFEASNRGLLRYFQPVAHLPGFARILAATLGELRGELLSADALRPLPNAGRDTAELLGLFAKEMESAEVADRATLLSVAARVLQREEGTPLGRCPVLLLDIGVESRADWTFLLSLVARSPRILVTLPAGDDRTRDHWAELPRAVWTEAHPGKHPKGLERIGLHLFSDAQPPTCDDDRTVQFFSAPGEARECIEIARRILIEAGSGVRFDEMAVFLRTPTSYSGLLESALNRAGVPMFFAHGTKRPDPSGRALLALLGCAAEGLSARRFAEYLSLSQVPDLGDTGAPPEAPPGWAPPKTEELLVRADFDGLGASGPDSPTATVVEERVDSDEMPHLLGSLRTPWKWEQFIVEAAVIGGIDRWKRRLKGLEATYRLRLHELRGDDPESPRLGLVERDLTNVGHLRNFALPVIDALANFPPTARWGEWLEILRTLVPRVLSRPTRVLEILAELSPLSSVGPVTIDEVCNVLSSRLANVHEPPPTRRYGRVYIGTPEQARGQAFEIVFVPGLAERTFPQRTREDPILLDGLRKQLGPGLKLKQDRSSRERLLLRLAVGSAKKRVYLSYPRIDVVESRPRVASFYALDVKRATTGKIPSIDKLGREAEHLGGARLAWPAPSDPSLAVDAIEHDLSVLDPLLHQRATPAPKGRARYLLEIDPNLGRSLRARVRRWGKKWCSSDGICIPTEEVAAALAVHRLTARPYSVSALQKFAACPYRFLLSAIYRLEPRKESAAIEQIDDLTRGSIFHRVQAELMRRLKSDGQIPLSTENLGGAHAALDQVLDEVANRFRDDVAPAIARVWEDGIEEIRVDLRGWLQSMAEAKDRWIPTYFELGIGFSGKEGMDPSSCPDPVELEGGYKLHGIVDLIELNVIGSELRVTDYKTGSDRTEDPLVVGGGEVLQPVLYSLAAEVALGVAARKGRLFYCTAREGFAEHEVVLNKAAREQGKKTLQIIDTAVEKGFLPAAPREGACQWCDFRTVCGPYEELRIQRKEDSALRSLSYLRDMP